MKTYTSNQVYAAIEITEWVPADVARELYEALDSLTGHAVYEGMTESEQQAIESLLAKARGES